MVAKRLPTVLHPDPVTGTVSGYPLGTGIGGEGDAASGIPVQAEESLLKNQYDAEIGLSVANDEVVNVLNELLESCRDGEYGFRACAEEVQSQETRQLFLGRAEQCGRAEAELVALVAQYRGQPAEGGTAGGAMHRGWVHVKGALGLDSDASMLESCESGEDTAIRRYQDALSRSLPEDVRSVILRQAEDAQRNHDQIRDLRNVARTRESL